MTVHAAATRPAGKSSGAAALGALVQLAVFVGVVITFLVAPLIALALAFLVYTVLRSRGEANRSAATAPADAPAFGFGSGAR
jgi:phosphate/sulfate permease